MVGKTSAQFNTALHKPNNTIGGAYVLQSEINHALRVRSVKFCITFRARVSY
jgi:hypothetical protein